MARELAHILLVEDNRFDIELTLDAFKKVRFANVIHVAHNGQEALDYLLGCNQYADRERYPLPELILLDLKMPGIDGHEVLRQIKCVDELKHIPVVILSSSAEEGDRALSHMNGADNYLVKPISFRDLIKAIKEVSDYWLLVNVTPPGRKQK